MYASCTRARGRDLRPSPPGWVLQPRPSLRIPLAFAAVAYFSRLLGHARWRARPSGGIRGRRIWLYRAKPTEGFEPSTPALRGRANPNDSRRWSAQIACKRHTSEVEATSAPHCRQKRRSDVWATIGPERAARTWRARRGLAGDELATER